MVGTIVLLIVVVVLIVCLHLDVVVIDRNALNDLGIVAFSIDLAVRSVFRGLTRWSLPRFGG
jgi:hypothetical protein